MQGESDSSLYFVESGLLKAYNTSEEGKETVKSFILSGSIIGSLTSINSLSNCSFSLVCLETSFTKKISFEVMRDFNQKDLAHYLWDPSSRD